MGSMTWTNCEPVSSFEDRVGGLPRWWVALLLLPRPLWATDLSHLFGGFRRGGFSFIGDVFFLGLTLSCPLFSLWSRV